MKLDHRNVCVIGAGKSGMGSVDLLAKLHANIIIYDGNENLKKEDVEKNLPDGVSARLVIGEFPDELLKKVDLFVVSPGVPLDIPVIEKIKQSDVEIIGEIELAYRYEQGQVFGITGTNGKTTTTSLLGHICDGYFDDTFVVGNIGTPYTKSVLDSNVRSVTVAELSSFQLESVSTFHPTVSTILNITPDHLNRHHTMDNYIDAKKNITINQDIMDFCILNYEDDVLREFGEELEESGKCCVVFFSSKRVLEHGIYLEDEHIYFDDGLVKDEICNVNDLKLVGTHNFENVMAASAMAIKGGVPVEIVRDRVISFNPVAHRMEFVCEKNGVKYYNDSKGTNPDAAIKAIEAVKTPTILLAGGYDKDSDYTEWINAFNGKVKKFILMGVTKDKIAKRAIELGYPQEDIIFVSTFEEAMDIAKVNAVSGDTILLSPACASWGMFDNYEQRGDLFKKLARE